MARQSEVRGGRDIENALTLLPARVAERVSKSALRAGAQVIRKEAKRLVPKDTGELAEGIVVQAPTRRQRRRGAALIVVGILRPVSRIAHLIEFGWRWSAAQPFLRPALDSKGAEAVRVIGQRMMRGIVREMQKIRRGQPRRS